MSTIIKIKKAALTGRGGGCFPVAKKWEMVKKASGEKKYVVCNASEGEPGIKKDQYILFNHGDRVIDGIKIAMDYLKADKAYIYLNHEFVKKLEPILKPLIKDLPIEIFVKPIDGGYIGGEETSLLNAMEGKRIEPRLRPPFPTTNGLWQEPTLVNNVETFYNVSLVASDDYKQERFFSLNGDCLFTGVYVFPEDWSIEKILKQSDNYPDFDFFVQVGGDASGQILNKKQLKQRVGGAGSITVFSMFKHKPKQLIKKWVNFYKEESCGKCTPCREGTYRLWEIINSKQVDWKMFGILLDNLEEASFCGLGCSASIAIKSYVKNVLPLLKEENLNLNLEEKKFLCDCFI